jgi:hypothetical protein
VATDSAKVYASPVDIFRSRFRPMGMYSTRVEDRVGELAILRCCQECRSRVSATLPWLVIPWPTGRVFTHIRRRPACHARPSRNFAHTDETKTSSTSVPARFDGVLACESGPNEVSCVSTMSPPMEVIEARQRHTLAQIIAKPREIDQLQGTGLRTTSRGYYTATLIRRTS